MLFLASLFLVFFMSACYPRDCVWLLFFGVFLCAHVTPSGYPPTAIGYPPTAIGYPPTAIVGRIGHSEFFFSVTAPPGGTADGSHDTHGRACECVSVSVWALLPKDNGREVMRTGAGRRMGPGPDPKLRLNSCGGGWLRCRARPCADLFALVAAVCRGAALRLPCLSACW